MTPLEDCQQSQTARACQAVHYGYVIGSPILLLMGTVGNVWITFVAAKMNLRKSPTAALITALAVMDTLALWTGIGRHFTLSLTGTDVRFLSPIACKAQRFVLYFAMDASATILAVISADRFLAVWLPHLRKSFTLTKARTTVLALAAASVVFNLHVLWTRGEELKFNSLTNATKLEICGYPKPEYEQYWKTYQGWFAMIYFCIVPFVVMFILNSLTVFKLRARRSGTGDTRTRSLKPRSSKDSRLTFMLLCTTMFFVLVTAPAFLYNTIESMFGYTGLDKGVRQRLKVIDTYSTLLQYLNHAINFYLYILTGHGFRRDVRESLNRIGCKCANPSKEENLHECRTTSSSGNGYDPSQSSGVATASQM